MRGDKVYYDIGAEPSTASKEVQQQMCVMESPAAYFVCVDSEDGGNPHPTGKAKKWLGEVPLKREQRQNADGQNVLELKTHKDFEIRYTTDGSNPKENGGSYSGDIVLPADCRFVLTAVYYKGELVGEETISVTVAPKGKKQLVIDDAKALEYTLNSQKKCGDTEITYAEFAKLKQLDGTYIRHFTVTISDKKNPEGYMEITTTKMPWDTGGLQTTVDIIRDSAFAGRDVEVEFEYKTILFTTGAAFKQWVEQNKMDWSDIQNKGAINQ